MSENNQSQAGSSATEGGVNIAEAAPTGNISITPRVLSEAYNIPEARLQTTAFQMRGVQPQPNSTNLANTNGEVITEASAETDTAAYCDKLLDDSEKIRAEMLHEARNSDKIWWGTRWIYRREAKYSSPHEILEMSGNQKQANHLRRCIELALDISDLNSYLDEQVKELNDLNKITTEKYEKFYHGFTDDFGNVPSAILDTNEQRKITSDNIQKTLNSLDKIENTRHNVNENTIIDQDILKAWSYDDRHFAKDVVIGAIPVWNAEDSGEAAIAYAKVGRYGMAATMSTFAALDAASTVASVYYGAGIATGAVTGVGKGFVKSGIKAALKRSTEKLRALFAVFKKSGGAIKGISKESAEKALTCAACLIAMPRR